MVSGLLSVDVVVTMGDPMAVAQSLNFPECTIKDDASSIDHDSSPGLQKQLEGNPNPMEMVIVWSILSLEVTHQFACLVLSNVFEDFKGHRLCMFAPAPLIGDGMIDGQISAHDEPFKG